MLAGAAPCSVESRSEALLALELASSSPDLVRSAELEPQPQKASILLVGTAEGNELDLLTTQLDLELVTRLEVKLHRVGPAHH